MKAGHYPQLHPMIPWKVVQVYPEDALRKQEEEITAYTTHTKITFPKIYKVLKNEFCFSPLMCCGSCCLHSHFLSCRTLPYLAVTPFCHLFPLPP